MKNLLPFIVLFLCACYGNAQQIDEKERITQIQNEIAEKENKTVQAVTNYGGKIEFWSFTELNDSIKSFEVWSYKDEYFYSEYYLLENGRLVYAIEWEQFIPYNHTPQSGWNCAYFLKNDTVFYHISLGHGKTETDDWVPEEIVTQFQKRVKQKDNIKEYYNP